VRFWYLGILLIGLMAAPASGIAQSRVALVIGNSSYQNAVALPNPVNDAIDISNSLKRLGFDVKTITNAKFDDMRRALIGFGQQTRNAEIAVVFFAGHGMEIGGENWLIPVDAQLATDRDAANEAIGLQSLTRVVSTASKLGLVILDACRSNPFLSKMQRTGTLSRAVDRGFTRVEPTDNVLVAYSARDGTTANDGSGRNSPFTSSLLRNIEQPNLEIRFLFATVRDDVMAATQREQQPYIYGSLSRDAIYLNPAAAGSVPAIVSPSSVAVKPGIDPALPKSPPPPRAVPGGNAALDADAPPPSAPVRYGSINYLTCDGSAWTASWAGNNFHHVPHDAGNGRVTHDDKVLVYQTWDHSCWSVTWHAGTQRFYHVPVGPNAGRAHEDIIMNYLNWNQAKRSIVRNADGFSLASE
jgi:hypothetical protein